MDPSIYNQIVNRTVADYEQMLRESDLTLEEIGDFLNNQMTELVPTCQRYIELRDWGREYLGECYMELDE